MSISLIDIAEQFEVTPQEIEEICRLIGIPVERSAIADEAEEALFRLESAAKKQGQTLRQAAEQIASANAAAASGNQATTNRFSLKNYFIATTGVDPETAPAGSIVRIQYEIAGTYGVQLGNVLHNQIMDVSMQVLRDRLLNGTDEADDATQGASKALERSNSAVGQLFLQTDWQGGRQLGQSPLLSAAAAAEVKQLQAAKD